MADPRFSPLPPAFLAAAASRRDSILLHTARPDQENQSSILFQSPVEVLKASSAAELDWLFNEIERAQNSGLHVAGFFTYECGAHLHSAPGIAPRAPEYPLAWFGVYDSPAAFNHLTGITTHPPELTARENFPPESDFSIADARCSIGETEYTQKVEAIHEYIRRGESYQVNLATMLSFEYAGSPLAAYRQLIAAQPTAYAAFLNLGDWHFLSFSPELYFRLHESQILTRPMKGTAPRGRTNLEDEQLALWLGNDLKNRGENVMIVDLLRNDIGRVAEYGSVRVEELFAVEKYRTLLQMTSTVSGQLRPGIGVRQILTSLFPCGSITGAPKLQTMKIIHALEGAPRGIYTGAIGYFAPDGGAVFNLAIRTLSLRQGRGLLGIGSGITIDSNPAQEFAECMLKAEFLTRREQPFSLIETLFWNGAEFPLLALHLDRLRDSARYFDFHCDDAALVDLLHSTARRCDPGREMKYRVLLAPDGGLTLTQAPLSAPSAQTLVAICPERVNSADSFLLHKTTRRDFYEQWLARAHDAGFNEILFLNERGEPTEGAISNLFIEQNGWLITPPVTAGLLPGVYRRHLLEQNPMAREGALTLKDLDEADAVYFCNAIRGLRKIKVGAVLK